MRSVWNRLTFQRCTLMKAVSTSEMSADFYQTALQEHCRRQPFSCLAAVIARMTPNFIRGIRHPLTSARTTHEGSNRGLLTGRLLSSAFAWSGRRKWLNFCEEYIDLMLCCLVPCRPNIWCCVLPSFHVASGAV
jgi:hypothetical protein